MELKYISPLSVLKVVAVSFGLIGALLGLLAGIGSFRYAGMHSMTAFAGPLAGLFGGLFSGLFAGLVSALWAVVYNIVAGLVGGIRFELRQ